MKRIIMILVIFCLFAISQQGYAHPPTRITVGYDPGKKVLAAKIYHIVINPKSHYIKKVSVSVNKAVVEEEEFTAQERSTNQTVKYELPDAEPGDVISIEAYCSFYGQGSETIEVE